MIDMSLTDLADMYIFVEVAGSPTLTAAAGKLDMPLSSLSRRIGAYERRVGLALVDRSTRRLKLTEAGERYFRRTQSIIQEARAAHHELNHESETLRGLVTLAVLSDSEVVAVTDALVAFSQQHSDVKVNIRLLGSLDELESSHADCALHSGQGRTQNYICRHIRSLPSVLVAHPDVVATSKLGDDDVMAQRLISCERTSTVLMEHRLSRHSRTFSFLDTLAVAHQSTVLSATLAGFGVAVLPYEIAGRYLAEGLLAEISEEWEPRASELFVTYKSRLLPLRARLLIDALCNYSYRTKVFDRSLVKSARVFQQRSLIAVGS
jgi:DNA-binding transcriptional LysR family regulator